jgi:hypothetical protein
VTRKFLLGFTLLAVILAAVYVRTRKPKTPIEVAYAGNREVIVYSTTALVRSPVTTLSFGDRVDILQRFQDQVNVRTKTGLTGWVSERDLLSADLWQKARDLELKATSMAVQARGHTKVLSNLRLEPGRDTQRLQQLVKGVSVDVLARQPMAVPSSKSGQQDESAAEPAVEKKEDWWLVRAHTGPNATLSGWLLGRFVELDVPRPLPDYASSANMRVVGWYELNRVKDNNGPARPQYLVVGTHGPEGQPCDFTMLRVFTWGSKRERYETAFVESNVCGKLPVDVMPSEPSPHGTVGRNAPDAQFVFLDLGDASPDKRTYVMHQTVVRRVREAGATSRPKTAAKH